MMVLVQDEQTGTGLLSPSDARTAHDLKADFATGCTLVQSLINAVAIDSLVLSYHATASS